MCEVDRLDNHHRSVCAKQDTSDNAHASDDVDMHLFLAADALVFFRGASTSSPAGLLLTCTRLFRSFGRSFSFCLCHSGSFCLVNILVFILA